MIKKRLPNPRLAKIHRNYSVEEIANLYKVHKNSVWRWIKDGLPLIDKRRPMLILGRDLAEFLHNKRTKNKRKCKPGEIYCVKCREPRSPAGDMADYQSLTETQGNLVGICPCCYKLIYQRINLAKLEQVRGKLQVTIPLAQRHINESTQPFVNSDLNERVEHHENSQSRQ